jgi:hypothetical protein
MADGTKVESVAFPARRLSVTQEPTADTTTNVVVNMVGLMGCWNDTPVEADAQEFLREMSKLLQGIFFWRGSVELGLWKCCSRHQTTDVSRLTNERVWRSEN